MAIWSILTRPCSDWARQERGRVFQWLESTDLQDRLIRHAYNRLYHARLAETHDLKSEAKAIIKEFSRATTHQ